MPRAFVPPTTAQVRRRFPELHPPLNEKEALAEAARCLYCYDAPCMRACPTHIDVPSFIRSILHRDPISAARTILDANIFGGSCARACPTEVLCEGACVDNTLVQAPIKIGPLQRYACDTAREQSGHFYSPAPPTGKRVAVIGSGPAGLTCAFELRKRGHDVDVFEASPFPGGLNTTGIAPYKITAEFALTEVRLVKQVGLRINLNQRLSARQIHNFLEEYDAVFLGIGLGATASLDIPGENSAGVWESLRFIAQAHTKPMNRCKAGRKVVVIGGGNTAIDAAVAARTHGAERVTIAYRRDRASMPAFAHEIELAETHGVEFEFLARPERIMIRNGKPTGVRCVRVKMKGRGRKAKLAAVRNSGFTIPADMVIKALGQTPLDSLLAEIPTLKVKKGRIVIDEQTAATSVPKLFAGGDCTNGGREIVDAVQAGKTAAAGIQQMLVPVGHVVEADRETQA